MIISPDADAPARDDLQCIALKHSLFDSIAE